MALVYSLIDAPLAIYSIHQPRNSQEIFSDRTRTPSGNFVLFCVQCAPLSNGLTEQTIEELDEPYFSKTLPKRKDDGICQMFEDIETHLLWLILMDTLF